MKVWEVDFAEADSPIDSVFERLVVLAENFEEAVRKALEWKKGEYEGLNLEIRRVEAIREVDLT